MKTIMVMFDTLTRKFLPNYGCDWVVAPNFSRLAERCCRFDNFYAGSMPCMPARRDLHTGRYNFLHRGWGPIEPFDRSVMEVLRVDGVYTHLVTDHSHYWEDGGCTYHNRYDTWEGFRGQEGDRWVAHDIEAAPEQSHPLNKRGISVTQHYRNRLREQGEAQMPSVRTFAAGLEFLAEHAERDDWFLQIEAFDPHEPFYVDSKYRRMYGLPEEETLFWPRYGDVPAGRDYRDDLELCQKEYAALLSQCDECLGRVLDFMDEHEMWDDTCLIVNTDHGFLLGEHEELGKNFFPAYDELAHLPFFLHVPGVAEGGTCEALCGTIDVVPTLLDLFGVDPEPMGGMDGRSLLDALRGETIHERLLFGIHGGFTCVTDGRHVYMRCGREGKPFFEYTLMPTNIRGFFNEAQLKGAELVDGGRFSHGVPVLRMPGVGYLQSHLFGDRLYDLEADPEQAHNLVGETDEAPYEAMLAAALDEFYAPDEEYVRLGLR